MARKSIIARQTKRAKLIAKFAEKRKELKEKYVQIALQHLDETAVLLARKKPLMELTEYLIQRES